MGNFRTEAEDTLGQVQRPGEEGFYSNDPQDAGKETIYGISRAANPDAEVWKLVDAWKGTDGFPHNMADDQAVFAKAMECAKARYWDPVKGDQVDNQAICQALFDTAYNMGPEEAIENLQNALNKLNRNQALYPDIPVTKAMDKATLDALEANLKLVDEDGWSLWMAMNILKGYFYFSHSNEKFFKGLIKNRTFKPETLRRLFPNRFGGRMVFAAGPQPPREPTATEKALMDEALLQGGKP